MAKVLTVDALVVCSHQGTGTVEVAASQHKLTVAGRPVLVLGDMEGKPVSGCQLPSSTACKVVVSTLAGAATKLTAGGKPVLLDTATGATNSGTWKVRSAGQTTFDAS